MRKICYILLLYIVAGCGTPEKKIPVLDFEKAIDHRITLNLEKYVEDCHFVKLETKDKCTLGVICYLYLTNSNIILSDRNFNIHRFNTEGEFVNKIGSLGRGPEEYEEIKPLNVLESTKEVFVGGYGTISKYNFDGDFISKIPVSGDKSMLGVFKMSDDGNTVYRFGEDPFLEFAVGVFDKSYQKVKAFKNSFVRKKKGIYIQSWLSKSKDNFYYKEMLNDTVCKITPDYRKEPQCIIKFGKYKFLEKDFDYELQLNTNAYSIGSMYFAEYFTYARLSHGRRAGGVILSFNKDNKLYHVINNNGRPFVKFRGVDWKIKNAHSDHLVLCLDPIEYLDNSDKVTDPELKELCKDLKEESNPILAILKIK